MTKLYIISLYILSYYYKNDIKKQVLKYFFIYDNLIKNNIELNKSEKLFINI